MKNIQEVSDVLLCSNCGACKTICPKDTIKFKESSIGRMYAVVGDECIDCGLCRKVCPSLNAPMIDSRLDVFVGNIFSVYTGKAVDSKIYQNAQSGGGVTATLAYLFQSGKIDSAIVCRMSMGSIPKVESVVITSEQELYETQKSCYTPVDMLSSLRQTINKKSVAFVGLPCHIEGLSLLQKTSQRYNNVAYKLGLICDRTLCSAIQDVFISKLKENGFDSKRWKIDWRRKNFTEQGYYYPYKTAPVVAYSSSEKIIFPNSYRFLLKDTFTPPRCRLCADKLNVCADIVYGDPWRMENIDWECGESVFVTRTHLGDALIAEMKKANILKLEKRENDEVLKGQLVAERKKSVSIYSKVFKERWRIIDSYLYMQNNDTILFRDLKQANKLIENFKSLEKKERKEIVRIALRKIKIYELENRYYIIKFCVKVYSKLISVYK